MPISSMTGFSRAEGETEFCTWSWELKSVNGKGRDTRCRIPSGYEQMEVAAREGVSKRLKRGNISVNLTVNTSRENEGYRVNQEVLDKILAVLPEIADKAPGLAPPRADGLLSLRGVIEPVEKEITEDAQDAVNRAILAGLDDALDALADMRSREGEKLLSVLEGQIDEIKRLCHDAAGVASLHPDAIKERLRQQIAELLEVADPLPEEQLSREAAILVNKADVREELDRLTAHVQAASELLAGGGAVGRKLDFLCQEFNREANTLCSKSPDLELTRIGLDLKAIIEQFREQVQNIE